MTLSYRNLFGMQTVSMSFDFFFTPLWRGFNRELILRSYPADLFRRGAEFPMYNGYCSFGRRSDSLRIPYLLTEPGNVSKVDRCWDRG